MQISYESIYSYIYAYPKGELKKLMIHSLRQSNSKREPRGSKNSNYHSIQPTSEQFIYHRPKEINTRQIPGHWEGDLILGSACKSCVGTLVERTTGYLILSKMQNMPAFLRLSMTYDRGSAMAQHKIMSDNLNINIYFADPHAPWQRGPNENTNGLLRQFLPKDTDLSLCSQKDLDDIAWRLNTRPRKRFDYKTPQEVMMKILIKNGESVALAS